MDAVPFHIGITTPDLHNSMETLSTALGISWSPIGGGDSEMPVIGGGTQPRPISTVSKEGPIFIDLIKGAPGSLWDTASPRIHHFAYWTDDLQGDVKRLEGEGWKPEMTFPDEDGNPTVFAYLVRDDGFRLELIDRAGQDAFMARLDE